MSNLRTDTEDAIDVIDAAVFSGDEFANPAARKDLRDMMARWERGLQEFDKMDPFQP